MLRKEDAMSLKNDDSRYGALSIGLHWLMLLLLVAVYATIELREAFPKGSDPRELLKTWHFMLGLTVFGLVWLRLAARFLGGSPTIAPPPSPWETRLAGAMHLALYALMIGLPLMGWLMLSAAGKPIPFFGMELPALTGENRALSLELKEVHEALATAGYILVGLHALAALYHHYLRRDNTLLRMLPAHGASR